MGGKQKQANRTKNNTRPSSSSRSAEKLGTNLPAFIGFSANQDGGYTTVLPGFSSSENFDANIDSSVQLILRKMTKKDPVTKLKALNEFQQFINFSNEDEVRKTLCLWPRLYCQLSSDCNHRVRECTQVAHSAITSKCGRSIAPYLKQLVPTWIISQYDTYLPAKNQAKDAFEKVFPKAKLSEVLAFCKSEILSQIEDNLIVHTPTSLSNPKLFTAEECELIYERTIIMSLQSYEFFISNLPEEHLDWLCDNQLKLLDNKKFWDLGDNKSFLIRCFHRYVLYIFLIYCFKSSCYAVIGCLVRRLSKWFEPLYGKKAIILTFKKLNEKECDIIVSVVENCILLMAYIPNWWTHVDVEKSLLPNIYMILSSGGWNNATNLGPLIVPLMVHLSNIPACQDTKFYEDYFDSICKGLEQRCVITSKTGYEAWLCGLIECLEKIADTSTNINDDLQKTNTITTLSKVIRLWLTTIIRPKISNSSFNYVKLNIIYVSKLAMRWTKMSISENASIFPQLVRIFWKNVHFLITTQISSMCVDEEEVKKITDVHIELLIGLKVDNTLKMKKSSRVKFNDNEDEQQIVSSNEEKVSDKNKNILLANFEHDLSNVVFDICGEYCLFAVKYNLSSPILNPLYSLVREFNCSNLHQSLLKSLKGDNKTLKTLYTDYYFMWLRGDSMRSPVVVDLTFSLLLYLNSDDQMAILKSFDQLSLPIVMWCVSRCISHPYLTFSSVFEWLQSDTVHQSLLAICKVIIKEGDKHYMELLKMCFVQSDNGGLLISKITCFEIVKMFINSLSYLSSDHLNMCASFASYLLSVNNLIINENYDIYVDLILALFNLDCNAQDIMEVVPQDTLIEISSSWQDGLSALPLDNLIIFAERASKIIHGKLNASNNIPIHLQLIEKLVDLSFDLICACVNVKNNDEDKEDIFYKIIFILLQNVSDNFTRNIDNLEALAFISDSLQGKLICPVFSDGKLFDNLIQRSDSLNAPIKEIELIQPLSWILFSIKVIEKIVIDLNLILNSELHDNEIKKLSFTSVDIISSPDIRESLFDLLHTISIIRTLQLEYKMVKWYEILMMYYIPIESTVVSIFKLIVKDNHNIICKFLNDKSTSSGMYWSYCLYLCENVFSSLDDKDVNSKLSNDINCIISKFEEINDISLLFSMNNSFNIQILNNARIIEECDELNLKSMSYLMLKCLYTLGSTSEGSKLKISSDVLKKCLSNPLSTLSFIIETYYSHKDIMLYDIDFSKSEWDVVYCNSSILRFLNTVIKNAGWQLQTIDWDFIMISLSSFVQSFDKTKHDWKSFKVSLLGSAIFSLFQTVSKFVMNILTESVHRQPSEAILQLLDEWREVFSPVVNKHIVNLFINICSDCVENNIELSPSNIYLINSLNDVMQNFDWKYLEKNENSDHNVTSILKLCLDTMASPCHHVLKYAANIALKSLTPSLIEKDKTESDKLNKNDSEENDQPISIVLSLHTVKPVLEQLQTCIEIILAPYKIGEDYCILLPYSDSHSLAIGYLLIWEILLDIAQESTAYLQHEYSEIFREGQFVDQLLNVLFRLLPEQLAQFSVSSVSSSYFKKSPKISYKDPISWELISWLACQRLLRCLQGGWLGALVRGWWGSLPTRSAQFVEQIVKTHISPLLITEQMSLVTKKQMKIANIEIIIHSSVNEVECVYIIEDLKMGLTIQLSPKHPLAKPLVVSSGSPLNNMTWLSMYLSHQNSSVYQAVRMWANAVQKKVESTPVCYVCYCRLHPSTGQLPKMLCQTCKNKFHVACLSKWFSTSGKSTCPMCRNVFNA